MTSVYAVPTDRRHISAANAAPRYVRQYMQVNLAVMNTVFACSPSQTKLHFIFYFFETMCTKNVLTVGISPTMKQGASFVTPFYLPNSKTNQTCSISPVQPCRATVIFLIDLKETPLVYESTNMSLRRAMRDSVVHCRKKMLQMCSLMLISMSLLSQETC